MSLDRDKLIELGWSFGACFTADSAAAVCDLLSESPAGDGIYITVTHDCSVIQPSLETEPFLEWLIADPIDAPHGHFLHARNIRRLHLEIEVDGEPKWFEMKMARRGFVARDKLDQCATDQCHLVSLEGRNILKRWLGNRYTSQTFPDVFNGRIEGLIKGSRSPLVRLFNTEIGKACCALYLTLAPFDQDLSATESYELKVLAMFRDEIAMQVGREAMSEFGQELSERLESVRGLGPVVVFALAESDATYGQIAKMARWQLDYISLAGGDEVMAVDQA